MQTKTPVPKRLLVIRTDRLGDVITSLPAIQAYKQHFPQVELHFLAVAELATLLAKHPAINRLWPLNTANYPSIGAELKAQQFDCCVSLVWDKHMQYLAKYLSAIPLRIAPLSKLGAWWWANKPQIQRRSLALKTEAEYNADLFKPLGLPVAGLPAARIVLCQEDLDNLKQTLHKALNTQDLDWLDKPFVVIHAGMGGSALNWSQDYYAWVIQQLAQTQVHCCLTGLVQEATNNAELISKLTLDVKPYVKDLSGSLNLRMLAALIHVARVYLGPSTGPTHLAQAVGTKIVTLYSPIKVQSATRWQPYGFQGHVLTPAVKCGQKTTCLGAACKDYFCLDKITPNLVLQHLKALLKA